MPWLMDRVCEDIEKSELGRLVLDGMIREIVAARSQAYQVCYDTSAKPERFNNSLHICSAENFSESINSTHSNSPHILISCCLYDLLILLQSQIIILPFSGALKSFSHFPCYWSYR